MVDRTIRHHTSKMYQEYFSIQSLVSQAQLLSCLLRRKKIRPILCFLGINQGDKNNVSDIVLNNIRSLDDLVGRKTGTKDHRAD
jgi:hypothetical protein